jgi:D-glycero-D-manno-heptose 1,7-bisphosphate phosphatase
MSAPLFPAVLIDRDGTLIPDVPYNSDPEKVQLFPGVMEALARRKRAGFQNVIVTNQSGIGRGRITPAQYAAVHARLLELLGPGVIDATYFCPDAPDVPSENRKPAPGMLLAAARELGLDLARSWMIGDKTSDLFCGRNAGVQAILVLTGKGPQADRSAAAHVANDFAAAADFIVQQSHAS